MATEGPGSLARCRLQETSQHHSTWEAIVNTIELIKRSRRDFPMAVLCLDQRGVWGEALEAEGITVHNLSRRPGFHPMLGRAVARAAAAHDATTSQVAVRTIAGL